MQILPQNDLVLVTENKTDNVTASGIVIEGRQDDTKFYTVQAAGSKVEGYKTGDVVVIDIAKVKAIKTKGLLFGLIKAEDILAIVE